ncbi:hypothetical protein BDR22DRAFT_296625 [Usnea florida]
MSCNLRLVLSVGRVTRARLRVDGLDYCLLLTIPPSTQALASYTSDPLQPPPSVIENKKERKEEKKVHTHTTYSPLLSPLKKKGTASQHRYSYSLSLESVASACLTPSPPLQLIFNLLCLFFDLVDALRYLKQVYLEILHFNLSIMDRFEGFQRHAV